jgi:multiple sugar transport system permease protein
LILLMLGGNLLPPQILLVPVAKLSQIFGLYDTLATLIAVEIGFGLGFYVFVLQGFMRSIPSGDPAGRAARRGGSLPGLLADRAPADQARPGRARRARRSPGSSTTCSGRSRC